MSPSKYFTYDQNHVKANGGLLSECSGPGVKTTEVEACMALVCACTDDGQAVQIQYNYYGRWLTGSLQVPGPCINARNLAHDFGVKLSRCMCSHASCPGWRNGWHM